MTEEINALYEEGLINESEAQRIEDYADRLSNLINQPIHV